MKPGAPGAPVPSLPPTRLNLSLLPLKLEVRVSARGYRTALHNGGFGQVGQADDETRVLLLTEEAIRSATGYAARLSDGAAELYRDQEGALARHQPVAIAAFPAAAIRIVTALLRAGQDATLPLRFLSPHTVYARFEDGDGTDAAFASGGPLHGRCGVIYLPEMTGEVSDAAAARLRKKARAAIEAIARENREEREGMTPCL